MSARIATQGETRGSRVKVRGALLALILLENGRQIRARISQLSINGGLVALEHPLDEGIKVTVLFHIGSTSIRSRAEMLFPMWATKGCLQPFRMIELDEQHRAALMQELGKLVHAGGPHEQNSETPTASSPEPILDVGMQNAELESPPNQ